MNCDLCNTSISFSARQFTPSQITRAVRAGLTPAEHIVSMGTSFGATRGAVIADWKSKVMADTTNWALCTSCAAKVDRLTDTPPSFEDDDSDLSIPSGKVPLIVGISIAILIGMVLFFLIR